MANKNKNASEIGGRAYEVIKERSKKNGTKLGYEYSKLDISRETISSWIRKGHNPSGYFLQQMALNGYDVHYILTGMKKEGAGNGCDCES